MSEIIEDTNEIIDELNEETGVVLSDFDENEEEISQEEENDSEDE